MMTKVTLRGRTAERRIERHDLDRLAVKDAGLPLLTIDRGAPGAAPGHRVSSMTSTSVAAAAKPSCRQTHQGLTPYGHLPRRLPTVDRWLGTGHCHRPCHRGPAGLG